MRILLIHPPFADPTQPYVSLPTLKGYLRPRGIQVDLLDLNVEAAHFLLAPDSLRSLAQRVERLYRDLNGRRMLDFHQQRQFRLAAEALGPIAVAASARPAPLDVFRRRDLFFDVAAQERARRHVDAVFAALDALHDPFRYGFNHASHQVVPWSFDLLDRHARTEGPLDAMYDRVLDDAARVPREGLDLVGLSIAFPSQIPEAWRLARRLRRAFPDAFLAIGGPSIHQVAVHLEEDLRQRLLDAFDGVGLFEGEETLAQLVPRLAEWRASGRSARVLEGVPNLMTRDAASGRSRIGPRHVLDLSESPAPDPEGLDLDRYLAPSRALLYAPTRGCYWNQCSFCYYGLSETATAKYREIPPARAAADMARLSREHGVKTFYVSCDVLSPAYAVKLAQALVDADAGISWSSDLKIERHFTPERCELLRRSGLRAAAFGIESGSDRILKLMRKGCDRETMTRVNRSFHEAGIATEWMTFTDHPGETVDEALATIDWIAQERDRVDLFIVGEFGLERGSAIFQDPAAFGVEEVSFAEGDELRLYAQFRAAGPPRTEEERERIDEAVGRLSAGWRLDAYPWAGANSTHHSLLYFEELGQDAFKTDRAVPGRVARELEAAAARHGLPEAPRFPVDDIADREERFLSGYLRQALYTTLPARRGGPGFALAPLSCEHFERAASQQPRMRRR